MDTLRCMPGTATRKLPRPEGFADLVIPARREDELPERRALIHHLGAAGSVLLKNDGDLLPLAPRPGQTVALFGWPAVQAQSMGGDDASVNAHHRTAPLEPLRHAWPGVNIVHQPGADLHRCTPVFAQPVQIEFYANAELQGPVVASQDSPNGEVLWFGHVPDGVNPAAFSCRARLVWTAQADGLHAFSLISVGRSRATLNGEAVLDAWSVWTRGDPYVTFGCDEVVHRRVLCAGDVVEVAVEFSNQVGGASADAAFQVNALRVGAGRELDPSDIAASAALALTTQASGLAQIDIPARAFASFDPATGSWCSRPGRYELRAATSSRDVRLHTSLSHGLAAGP